MALSLAVLVTGGALVVVGGGCKSTSDHHAAADKVAGKIIDEKQQAALGRTEPFTIETPADTLRRRLMLDQHLPYSHPGSLGTEHIERLEKHYPTDAPGGEGVPAPGVANAEPLRVSLIDALQIAAQNSREYQTQKEAVYLAALGLDLERDEFRTTFTALLNSEIVRDLETEQTGWINTGSIGASQQLRSGALISARLGLDIAKLLSSPQETARGVFADMSVSIPLLRGAGAYIVAEPLTQAERDVIYALWTFENFKRDFAVNVATQYLAVLEQVDAVQNAENNYERLISNTIRTRAVAEAGEIPLVQIDQSINNELRARERWINARETFGRRADSLKVLLGLPPDAKLQLDRGDLERLSELQDDILAAQATQPSASTLPATGPAGLLEAPRVATVAGTVIEEDFAIALALQNRLDLRQVQGEVYDAQRRVRVAANALQAGLTLTGDATSGGRRSSANSAASSDVGLDFTEGVYAAGLQLDLPLERTSERNQYRQSLINLGRAVRNLQDVEDEIKLDVRNTLRDLVVAREGVQTQAEQVTVAQRRRNRAVGLFEAGRTDVRDVLEAEDALITAQNSFTSALIDYRLGQLRLQRDMGVLEVNHQGLWTEYAAATATDAPDGASTEITEQQDDVVETGAPGEADAVEQRQEQEIP